MVKASQLRNLAIITALLLAAAVWVSLRHSGDDPAHSQGAELLPGLSARMQNLERLELTGANARLVIVRAENEDWVIASLDDYPADSFKVQAFLRGLVLARRLAPKSSNREFFERMGLAATAVRVQLFDRDGGSIVALDFGKRRLRPQDGSSETFVNLEADGRAWTIQGLAEAGTDPLEWADRMIAQIDEQRIWQIAVVSAGDDNFTLSRETPGAATARVILPEGEALDADAFKAERLMSALSELELEGLRPVTELPEDALEIASLSFATFDGLVIALSVIESGGASFVRLAAFLEEALVAVEEGGVAPAGSMPADEEAIALNALWKGWAYNISPSRLADMLVKRDELTRQPVLLADPEGND